MCVLILDTLSASSTSHNDFIGVLMKADSFVNQSHISLTFFAYGIYIKDYVVSIIYGYLHCTYSASSVCTR